MYALRIQNTSEGNPCSYEATKAVAKKAQKKTLRPLNNVEDTEFSFWAIFPKPNFFFLVIRCCIDQCRVTPTPGSVGRDEDSCQATDDLGATQEGAGHLHASATTREGGNIEFCKNPPPKAPAHLKYCQS